MSELPFFHHRQSSPTLCGGLAIENVTSTTATDTDGRSGSGDGTVTIASMFCIALMTSMWI